MDVHGLYLNDLGLEKGLNRSFDLDLIGPSVHPESHLIVGLLQQARLLCNVRLSDDTIDIT